MIRVERVKHPKVLISSCCLHFGVVSYWYQVMENYDTYLRSPVCPTIAFCAVVLLFVYKRHFTVTETLTLLDVLWCNIGGIIVALCAPILVLSIVPVILLGLWWHSWNVCTSLCSTSAYQEIGEHSVVDIGASNS